MSLQPLGRPDAGTGAPVVEDRCPITRERHVWRLQGPCTIDTTLELPEGVTLDGQGMVITLRGEPEQFDSVGVRIAGAAIRDVTIDGQGLQPCCPHAFSALVVSGTSEVENVTVTNTRFGSRCQSGVGIEVAVFNGETANLRQVTVSQARTGILLAGQGRATVTRCSIRSAATAITLTNTVDATITGVATEAVDTEICVTGQAEVTLHDFSRPARLPAVTVIDNGMATVGNVTLAGFGSRERALAPTPGVCDLFKTPATLSTVVPLSDSRGTR